MNKKKIDVVKIKIKEALEKIDEILLNMEKENKDRAFSISREKLYGKLPESKYGTKFSTEFFGIFKSDFIQIKKELEKMLEYLNKEKFSPMYGKFLLDIRVNSEGEKFIDYLLEISSFYKKYT